MQNEKTITRYLLKLASSSVNCTLFADRCLRFDISTRKHAIAGGLRDRTWWSLQCSLINVPDLTPNSSSCESQQSKMLHNNIFTNKLIARTLSKHSATRNVVQPYKVNNATPSRVRQHGIMHWLKKVKQLTKQKSLFETLLWLPYDVH